MLDLSKIECESPVIIVNHHALDAIISLGGYWFDDVFHKATFKGGYKVKDYMLKFFSPRRVLSKFDKLEDKIDYCNRFFAVDQDGVQVDLWLLVPCRKCIYCREKRRVSFVNKLKFHATAYKDKPYFVTLTYDDQHLPSNGVQRRDIQLFIKKLRELYRKSHNIFITHSYVAEYGTKTHRPHYHILIFGTPSSNQNDCNSFYCACQYAWSTDFRHKDRFEYYNTSVGRVLKYQRGLVNVRVCDGRKAIYDYVGKYLRKENIVPKGCNPVFCQSSYNLGILSPFWCSLVQYLTEGNYKSPFQYVDSSGHISKLIIDSYYLNKILPSLSRYTSKVRYLFNNFLRSVPYHSLHSLPSYFDWLFNKYPDLFPFSGRCNFYDFSSSIPDIPNLDYLEGLDLSFLREKFVNYVSQQVKSPYKKNKILQDISNSQTFEKL